MSSNKPQLAPRKTNNSPALNRAATCTRPSGFPSGISAGPTDQLLQIDHVSDLECLEATRICGEEDVARSPLLSILWPHGS